MKPSVAMYFVPLFLAGALLWTTLGAADDHHSSEGNHSSGDSSSGGRSAGSGGSGQDGGESSSPQSSVSSRSDLPGSLGIPSGQASGDAVDAGPDEARHLVERGLIRPLQEILVQVRNEAPGDIVGITLAQRKGHWVYGFKVLTRAGKRLEITVDARTMALLSTRP